jgi:transposase
MLELLVTSRHYARQHEIFLNTSVDLYASQPLAQNHLAFAIDPMQSQGPSRVARQVYLALGATDMRKGFDGLSVRAQEVLRKDPFSGPLFSSSAASAATDQGAVLGRSGSLPVRQTAGAGPVHLAAGAGWHIPDSIYLHRAACDERTCLCAPPA